MLLALIPEAFITATIRPCINAEPVLFIILILALIHAAVVPNVYSHPLHIVIKPFAFVASAEGLRTAYLGRERHLGKGARHTDASCGGACE